MRATAPGVPEHPHPRVVHYTLVALTSLSVWGDNALGPGLSSPVKKPPSCSLASRPLGLAVAICETGLAVQAPRLAHTFLVFLAAGRAPPPSPSSMFCPPTHLGGFEKGSLFTIKGNL